MTTQIHDSTTCTAGFDGQPCVMCQFAREFEKSSAKLPSDAPGLENQGVGFLEPEPENVPEGEYGSGIAIPAPSFEQEWESAPRWATRTTEHDSAEYWFLRGTIAEQLRQTREDNRIFRQMAEQRGLTK